MTVRLRIATLAAAAVLAATACQRPPSNPAVPSTPGSTGAEAPAAPAVTYRARGNEPSWSVEIDGDVLRWTTPDAPEPRTWSGLTRTADANGFAVAASADGGALSLAARRAICRDSMSGMPYPDRVEVRIDGTGFTGCGGEPMALLAAHEWTITSIAGTEIDGRAPTLTVQPDGSAGGFAGCNRWTASMALTGEGLGFGRAAATMMACPEDDMRVEQAFLDALAKVTHHDFDAEGRLLLKAGDDPVIEATPAPKASRPTT